MKTKSSCSLSMFLWWKCLVIYFLKLKNGKKHAFDDESDKQMQQLSSILVISFAYISLSFIT